MNATHALVLAGIAAFFLPGISIAQDSKSQIYAADTYGNDVTTQSEEIFCVRRSEWTPARATQSCDPAIEMNQAHQVPVSAMMAEAPRRHAESDSGTPQKRRHDGKIPYKDPVQ